MDHNAVKLLMADGKTNLLCEIGRDGGGIDIQPNDHMRVEVDQD